jgi:hypothetical protein
MSFPAPVSTIAGRLMLPLALILLAGCHSPRQPVAVTSPPPPILGSTPIAAYDAYALAIKPQVGTPRSEHFILISTR